MSDLNSLQSWYDTSLTDQKNSVSYKVCCKCHPKIVWQCGSGSVGCECDQNAAIYKKQAILKILRK